jgi:predicted transcriptional regulator of viral defense system
MNNLRDRIKRKVKRSEGSVFMIDDFIRLSKDKNQIQRALRELVSDGVLVRVGKGVYVRAILSFIDGLPAPETTLRDIATAVIEKKGGIIKFTPEQLAYNEKRSTQVPNMNFIGTNRRISRKIKFRQSEINYVMVK